MIKKDSFASHDQRESVFPHTSSGTSTHSMKPFAVLGRWACYLEFLLQLSDPSRMDWLSCGWPLYTRTGHIIRMSMRTKPVLQVNGLCLSNEADGITAGTEERGRGAQIYIGVPKFIWICTLLGAQIHVNSYDSWVHAQMYGVRVLLCHRSYGIEVVSINVLSTAVDCGDLDDPDYGNVDFNSTIVASEATYTCHHGYYLVGDVTRVCQYSGKWSGYAPVCKRIGTVHDCDSVIALQLITWANLLTFCQQLLAVETWMILIMEMLSSAVQQLGPRQLTPVTRVTIWLDQRLVYAYTKGNGVEIHHSVNVSSYIVHDFAIGSMRST